MAFGKQQSIDMEDALDAIEDSLPAGEASEATTLTLYDILVRDGFAWEPRKSDKLERGIPSFMDYVRERHQRAAA